MNVKRDPVTGDYTWVRAEIGLEDPIDLIFLQLAGDTSPAAGQPYTGGPKLAFETGPTPRFALTTGINFPSSPFLVTEVSVARTDDGGTRFTGRLTTPRLNRSTICRLVSPTPPTPDGTGNSRSSTGRTSPGRAN